MYCTAMKNAVIAVGLTGGGAEAKEEVVNTDNDSAVESEAECEAFTALDHGTGPAHGGRNLAPWYRG